jgi:hypothetical protein
MRHSRRARLGAILALGVTVAMSTALAATAGQVFQETFHDEGTDLVVDFCDVDGLTVEVSFVVDGRVHIVPHGKERLDYFLQHATVSEVFTNVANEKRITAFTRVIEKDKRVTDNGDGTLTIIVMATGNATLYGANGKAIARNPGQVRFGFIVDHNGTPSDPFDDEFVADLGVLKASTGRSDDFCEAAVPALN